MDGDDDDLTFEQIKKLQQDRKNNNTSNYNTEIVIKSSKSSRKNGRDDSDKRGRKRRVDDEDDLDGYDQDKRENIRNAFDSYTAPKHILESIPADPDDIDPIKEYRAKTVAEQETEYQSRWRKRGFSPPRDYDPFTGKGQVKGRSYKDIMIENQLAKEEKELKEKIEKKKREEQSNQRKERRQQEIEKEKETNIGGDNSVVSPSSIKKKKVGDDSGNVVSSSSTIGTHTNWSIKCYKNGKIVGDPVSIVYNRPVTLGRDASKNVIHLEHPSCSSNHASITIVKEGKRPILMDLRSTNQTLLNGKPIEPYHPNELYQGDKIQFGGSSRDYIIYHT